MSRKCTAALRRGRRGPPVAPLTTVLVVAFLLGEGLAGQRSPADLPGLYLWYKADSITPAADTEIVTRWDDAGPNKLALDEPD